jgi:hypothetical protein
VHALKRGQKKMQSSELYYFNSLQIFDNYPEKKLLIYYEDFIANPEETLKELSQFTNQSCNLDEFLMNLQKHKQSSLQYYKTVGTFNSFTKGDNPLHFSQNFTTEEKCEIDAFVAKNYPILMQKYLYRYKENL